MKSSCEAKMASVCHDAASYQDTGQNFVGMSAERDGALQQTYMRATAQGRTGVMA